MEPNSSLGNATKTSLPAILAGTIARPGDEDLFEITVESGQELVFEEAASQIGSLLKPVITILAPDHSLVREFGKEYGGIGSAFTHRFDKAGTYYVRLSDYEKNGSKKHFYRVKVGSFPWVESAYPLGIKRGETAEVALQGFNLGDGKLMVEGKPSWKDDRLAMLRAETDEGRSFNEVKLVLGDDPEVESAGYNTSVEKAQRVNLPLTINGHIAAAEGSAPVSHYFRFTAKKDQLVLVDVAAARLGSRVGFRLWTSSTLRASRSSRRQCGRWPLPVQIWPITTRGRRTFAWSSRRTSTPATISCSAARSCLSPACRDNRTTGSRSSRSRRSFLGGRAVRIASFGTTAEAHAKGTAIYKVQIHPPGKQFPSNGLPLVRLYYTNDDGPFPHGMDSFLRFKAPADGEYVVRIRDGHGRGGEDYAYRLMLRAPREDFRIYVEPRNPNVPQGERIPLRVTAFRFDGFDGDIRVSPENLPERVHASDVVIPSGQLVGTVLLRADAEAKVGQSFPLKVKGVAEVGGREVVKWANPDDTLKLVSVVPPADVILTTDKREVVLEPGQDAKITVSVTRKNGFGGRVPVKVLNLPPHTDTPEVGLNGIMITEEQDRRTFSIRALPQAKPIELYIYCSAVVETRSPLQNAFASEPILVKIVPKSGGDSAGSGGE